MNRPIGTKLGWSYPIMFPTCPPWWNLVHNSKSRLQWQSRDQILIVLKFKMADGRHIGKYWKCCNSLPMEGLRGNLGDWVIASHRVADMSAMMRLPWRRPLPSNCALSIEQLWASAGRTREQFWWNLVHNSKLRLYWQSRDQILKFLKFKMADGRHIEKCWKCCNSPNNGGIWMKVGW